MKGEYCIQVAQRCGSQATQELQSLQINAAVHRFVALLQIFTFFSPSSTLVSLYKNYHQDLGTVYQSNDTFMHHCSRYANHCKTAILCCCHPYGGELSLALELLPVASLTTPLHEAIK